MQRTLLPVLAALAGHAAATTTASATATSSVIDLNLPNLVDGDATVMGSIMGVDATATSYSLTCPTDSASLDCGLGNGIQVVEGPAVLEVHMTQVDVATIDVSCAVASNTASCTTSMTTVDWTLSGSLTSSSTVKSSGTAVITNLSSYTFPVTVTAGLEKLSANGTAVSTGGVPKITQNAAVLAGAAMLAGGVMLI